MENSRKSPDPGLIDSLQAAFERALEAILARAFVYPVGQPRIAIAYSGGLDSSLLLHLCSRYALARGIPLYAFHIHHGLSPNAAHWQRHCEEQAHICRAFFATQKVHVDLEQGQGVEEAARIERYAALGQLARSHRIGVLLTAHHQDDQAETFMLQALRGAGLPGLSAMAAYHPQHELLGKGVALARPLLGFSRAQLESAAAALALDHIHDESNQVLHYRRNALRNQVFPLLQQHFPGFPARLARSASHAQDAQELLHEVAGMDLAACQGDPQGKTLELAALQGLSRPRVDNLLRHWLTHSGLRAPSSQRLREIRAQLLEGRADGNPQLDFGAVILYRSGERIQWRLRGGQPPATQVLLRWHDEAALEVPDWQGRLLFETVDRGPALDPARLRAGPLVLRPRQGRERIRLAHNRPSRSLKNLYQEAGVPGWRRPWLPLLYLGDDLIFVAGLGMDIRHTQDGPGVRLRWDSRHQIL